MIVDRDRVERSGTKTLYREWFTIICQNLKDVCIVFFYRRESIHRWIRVITKLPNSEQSYKGKVKTHNYINRQNQSTTRKLWKRNDPDLVQAFLKKWWVESDFKAPNLPLSLRFKGSGCHCTFVLVLNIYKQTTSRECLQLEQINNKWF
jgi:hypothetical protein